MSNDAVNATEALADAAAMVQREVVLDGAPLPDAVYFRREHDYYIVIAMLNDHFVLAIPTPTSPGVSRAKHPVVLMLAPQDDELRQGLQYDQS